MTLISRGIDEFAKVCCELGIVADLGAPAPHTPRSLLGQPLDETLVKFYGAHDGGWWSAPQFNLHVFPTEGPGSLEWRNTSIRRTDGADVYPYDRLLIFAQIGRRAAYLATVLGAQAQAVISLDDSEIPWAVPIAASVDAAFRLLADYLRCASATDGLSGLEEVAFPLEVPKLVATDHALGAQIRRGELDALVGSDASIQQWIAKTFA